MLGTVFTIKMVARVGIAPIAGAFADRVPRRALLVTLNREHIVIATLAALLLAVMPHPGEVQIDQLLR